MRKQILFILSLLSISQVAVSNVDAFGFGKLASAMKSAAQSPMGKSIAAKAVKVVGAKSSIAGALFGNAVNSMHSAVEEEKLANNNDEYADTAEDDGDDETAASHRNLAKKHRENAENHRAIHKNLVSQLKNKHGVDFHAQYKQHVLPALQKASASDDDEDSEAVDDEDASEEASEEDSDEDSGEDESEDSADDEESEEDEE